MQIRATQSAKPTATRPSPAVTRPPEPQTATSNQALQRALRDGTLRARLEVSQPGDSYEREADHVADQVMRGGAANSPPSPASTRALRQIMPFAGAAGGQAVGAGFEAQVAATRGRGAPLSPDLRGFYESRMGYDLSAVRVHTDAGAGRMASEVSARAFTVGPDIYFAPGQYQPASRSGQWLIAHELAHTVQQSPASARRAAVQRLDISSASPRIGRLSWDDARKKLSAIAHKVPGYRLLTLLLKKDPITDGGLNPTANDYAYAVLEWIPFGKAIYAELEKNKTIEKSVEFVKGKLKALDLSWGTIMGLVDEAKESLGVRDVFDIDGAWTKVKGIFQPTFDRVVDTAEAIFDYFVEIVRTQVLKVLKTEAEKVKGYKLLTLVLQKDPFTDEEVEFTLKKLVDGILELFGEDGERVKKQLEESKAIERAQTWFKDELDKLELSVELIIGTFKKAWDVVTVEKLLTPVDLIKEIVKIFAEPVTKVITFIGRAAKKVIEFIFEGAMIIAGPVGQQVADGFRRAKGAIDKIIADPLAFVTNLLAAIVAGFKLFSKNILVHLKQGLIAWLTGALTGAGITLPKKFDIQGVLSLVLQLLGISWPKIREKLVKRTDEKTVARLEAAFDFIKLIVTQGIDAVWEKLLEKVDSFVDSVMNGIRDWVVTRLVVAAVAKVALMSNPFSGILEAARSAYNMVAFFIERAKQILALVEAILLSIEKIASGQIEPASQWVERAMGRTVPVILGFFSRMIGLGDVSGAIKKVLEKIQGVVDKAIDRMLDWIIEKGKALLAKAKELVGKALQWWKVQQPFKGKDGASHTVRADRKGKRAEISVQSTKKDLSEVIDELKASPAATTLKGFYDGVNSIIEKSPEADTGTAEKADAHAKEHNAIIGKIAEILSKEYGEDMPTFVSWKKTSGDRSFSVIADPLTHSRGNVTPAESKGLDPVQENALKNILAPAWVSKNFVAAHLLHSAFGPNDYWNVTASGKSLNTSMWQTEHAIYDNVTGKKDSTTAAYKFSATVSYYESSGPPTITEVKNAPTDEGKTSLAKRLLGYYLAKEIHIIATPKPENPKKTSFDKKFVSGMSPEVHPYVFGHSHVDPEIRLRQNPLWKGAARGVPLPKASDLVMDGLSAPAIATIRETLVKRGWLTRVALPSSPQQLQGFAKTQSHPDD